MKLRFTLYDDSETLVINAPDGTRKAELSFERHPELYSVHPRVDTPLDFIGVNELMNNNGGRDFLLRKRKELGPDGVVGLLIERSPDDGFTWIDFQDYEVPLSDTYSESVGLDHRVQTTLKEKGFWTKLMNGFEKQVDLNSTTNEDGTSATVYAPIDLRLTTQIIPYSTQYSGEIATTDDTLYRNTFPASPLDDNSYDSWGPAVTDLGQAEIENSDVVPFYINETAAVNVETQVQIGEGFSGDITLQMLEDLVLSGQFNGRLECISAESSDDQLDQIQVALSIYTQKNSDAPVLWAAGTDTLAGVTSPTAPGIDVIFSRDVDITVDHTTVVDRVITMASGDTLKIIVKYNFNFIVTEGGFDNIDWVYRYWFITNITSNFKYTFQSSFPESQTVSELIHDAFAKVCDRILGENGTFYSPALGSPYNTTRTYGEEGSHWAYAISKILQIRGYSLTEKPFFASMRDLWSGANPIFNIGMGVTKVSGVDKILIAKKEDFFPDRVSIRLSGVYKIRQFDDGDLQFSSIEDGYEKYQIENVSGIDIPQSERTTNTVFKRIGKRLVNKSKFIAGDLVFEDARRTLREKSADYKYDDEIGIINVKRVEDAPYEPVLDEGFTSVTGLQNEATRYNKILTPRRNFLRWLNYYSIGLQNYLTSFFRFASGKGNYDMTATMTDNGEPESYGGVNLSEKGDIQVSDSPLITSELYEIQDHFITSAQIEALLSDPDAAIEISQTDTDFVKFYIKNLKVTLATGEISGTLWAKEHMDLQQVEKTSRIFSGEFGEAPDGVFG